MAKLKIVGITESKGIYNEIKYRNLVLNLTTVSEKDTIGSKVETAKIKWKNLDEVFDLNMPDDTTCESYYKLSDFQNLIGRYCHIYYDKWRTVTQVIVEEAKPEKPVEKSDTKDSKSA